MGNEINPILLSVTGNTRKLGGVPKVPYEYTGGGFVETSNGPTSRAVDSLPKCKFVPFTENIAPQAGYEAGVSKMTLWA